jgi:cytochrome c553
MIVLRDGQTAVLADPDRDAVYVVDTMHATLTFTVVLNKGDEPGRLVEDGTGRVHVALRAGGDLVTFDPTSGAVLTRRTVCPAPRGVAWDSSTDLVWVACATGELVGLPSAGGAATRSFVVERDLRDVVVQNGSLSVTEFRSAQVLRIASDGSISRRDSLPNDVTTPGPASSSGFVPHTLWRAVGAPSQGMVMVHQGHSTASIPTQIPGGYSQGAGGAIVESNCAVMSPDGQVSSIPVPQTVLPVDVALSPDGSYAAVVGAGDGFGSALPEVTFLPLVPPVVADDVDSGAANPLPVSPPGAGPLLDDSGAPDVSADPPFEVASAFTAEQPVAVAFDGIGHVLVQMREPAELRILNAPASDVVASETSLFNPLGGTVVGLSTISRADTGHDIFHASAGATIACASCHPEGGDDGHVWLLDGNPRRTPSLRGTIAGTAPYHWPGDEKDFSTLTVDVYTGRMGGISLASDQTSALQSWVESIPAPPKPSWLDPASTQRGQAVFESATTRCATCHLGPKLTNNETMSVGTCGAFQVPPLVGVGWRAPLMHNGCASTLGERFTKCATTGHGDIASLSAQDVSDLTTYLESL